MVKSEDNNNQETGTKSATVQAENKSTDKKYADYTEEEFKNLPPEKQNALRKEARKERDARLEDLRFKVKEEQAEIKKLMLIHKNMGKFPDSDAKQAVSLCISALARHDDEKALKGALQFCDYYKENQRKLDEIEAQKAEKAKIAASKKGKSKKVKGKRPKSKKRGFLAFLGFK